MKKIALLIVVLSMCLGCMAQTDSTHYEPIDSDSIFTISSDSVLLQGLTTPDSVAEVEIKRQLDAATGLTDTVVVKKRKQKRDWTTWVPNPQRATWLALVIPGGGQIYNRKFWKLPIVYGGFLGCIYALTWNNMMYKDYAQAYLDISDSDPGTKSYEKFMHLGNAINDKNIARYTDLFKSRRDKYRRWRDMSLFVMIGIYALSVVDAYVDAELSVFDISRDLSLKVKPTVIGNPTVSNPIYASSIGVNCQLSF